MLDQKNSHMRSIPEFSSMTEFTLYSLATEQEEENRINSNMISGVEI